MISEGLTLSAPTEPWIYCKFDVASYFMGFFWGGGGKSCLNRGGEVGCVNGLTSCALSIGLQMPNPKHLKILGEKGILNLSVVNLDY